MREWLAQQRVIARGLASRYTDDGTCTRTIRREPDLADCHWTLELPLFACVRSWPAAAPAAIALVILGAAVSLQDIARDQAMRPRMLATVSRASSAAGEDRSSRAPAAAAAGAQRIGPRSFAIWFHSSGARLKFSSAASPQISDRSSRSVSA